MRAIDADYLKGGFEDDGHLSPYIEEFINACPTLDVEPVRHGWWCFYQHDNMVGSWHCSVCDRASLVDAVGLARYCAHCGAKMDARGDEDESD